MKIIFKILGAIWMAICAYFSASLIQGLYRISFHFEPLSVIGTNIFYIVLFLVGTVAGFCLLRGARWPGIALAIIALFTFTGSMMAMFTWFDLRPFSAFAIVFDVFTLISAGVFLFGRNYAMA